MVPIFSRFFSAKSVVRGGLGVTGPGQYSAGHGRQREDMARLHDIIRFGIGSDGCLHRAGAICSGDAGVNSLGGLDRQGEIGFLSRRVVHHGGQVQLSTALFREGQAHQAPGLAGHEVHVVGVAVLRRHHHHALVVAVGVVVQQDHHAALAEVGN